jgi:DNA-binding NtrC family response regulator
MSENSKVLLIEDENLLAQVYLEYLADQPCDVVHVDTGRKGLEAIAELEPDVILTDLALPDLNGMDIVKHVTDHQLPITVVVVTGQGSLRTAVEAMRAGAFDFLVKPVTADRLVVTLRNALERQRLRQKVEIYEHSFGAGNFHDLIGSSLAMQAAYQIIASAAASRATVFISGESGTGKELCAEAIHKQSPRRDMPFIAINCAAIPKDLIESELFGHVKGAFTSAIAERDGAATMADGGTLFFDEICDMNLDMQTKLLRFIQTGTFNKVGSDRLEKVDVRFICATNRDPLAEVEAGRFREDLYYRLHVIPIEMPPLRNRGDDVLAIARHFLTAFAEEEGKRFQHFEPETEAVLGAYEWPGNVRQLQNVVRNIAVLHDGDDVTRDMLPAPLNELSVHAAPAIAASPIEAPERAQTTGIGIQPLWLAEKEIIENAITRCQGDVGKAAALLGINSSTIYRKRRRWDTMESPSASPA